MTSLFHIGIDLQRIRDNIDESGEIGEGLDAFLDTALVNEGEEIDCYVGLIRTLEMEQDKALEEATDYQMKAAARGKAIDRLKARMMEHLAATGRVEVKTATGRKVKIVGNGGKVPLVVDDKAVPDEYTKPVWKIDTELIRRDLESGMNLGFARFGERGQHLKIN